MKKLIILFCSLVIFVSSVEVSLCGYIYIKDNHHDFTSIKNDDGLSIYITNNSVSEISGTIKSLTNVKRVSINMSGCDAYPLSQECIDRGKMRINLPVELFTLPNLETLSFMGRASYTVNDTKGAIHSSIKKIYLNWTSPGDLSFLSRLDNIDEVTIKYDSINVDSKNDIPEYIYDMKNIRRLSVKSNEIPLKLSNRICEMRNLEELDFDGTIADFPTCANGMDKVKTVAIVYCGGKEKINGEEYYFPKNLLQFKNIQNLSIAACGKFGMPPYAIGLKKLKNFQLGDCMQDEYAEAQRACPDVYQSLYSGHGMNIDTNMINIMTLSEYTNIETIFINKWNVFDPAKDGRASTNNLTLREPAQKDLVKKWNAGQQAFTKSITDAVKSGKLPHLKKVVIPDLEVESTILVFPFENKQSD